MESESERDVERSIREQLKQVGLDGIDFEEEGSAPVVDPQTIDQLAQQGLNETKRLLVLKLVARYESWFRAYVKALSTVDRQTTQGQHDS